VPFKCNLRRYDEEGNNDPGLLLSAEIDGKIQMLQSSVQFTVRPCTLTPPDPQLKCAWYPGGFNPCTYEVKTRFQNLPFSKCNLYCYFAGGVRHNIVSRAGGKFCVYPRLPRHPRGKARRKQSVRRGDGASSAAAVHEDMWADGDLFVGAY
jgi:hypothetical protein